jgi:hypothetical protein
MKRKIMTENTLTFMRKQNVGACKNGMGKMSMKISFLLLPVWSYDEPGVLIGRV